MSASDTSMTDAINGLQQSTILFSQVYCIFLLVFGTVGHLLSIYVFTRPALRSNPCIRYFLASAISGSINVCILVPIRMLQLGYGIDIFIYSLPVCQVLSYFLGWIRLVPVWFISMASIDRFLASSPSATLRGWSSIRITCRVIPVIVLFISLIYIHYPFNQIILLLPQPSCTFATSSYRAFFSIWNLIFWSWIPTILMLVSGLLTIRNIHKSKNRTVPQNIQNNIHENNKRMDRQLIRMLIIQCFVFSITTTILSIIQLYVSITNNLIVKDNYVKARDQFAVNIGNFIALFGPCMSFYFFTLSSKLFRRHLINGFRRQQPIQNTTNTNAQQRHA
ncbi:unnamed protein product [Adineta steineri]|uniref:G-protein coupled receptors family 1 profile domain-containing protein n=1 Tax=Adineta steineri TaxID=433720 RepID=A0A814WWA5_9BILA|nr:unnamed protein product [Adineta steineri]CAF3881598.1 unnamed protein product [Adineta steineri]